MGLKEDFEAAAARVKNFKTRPTDDELLALYGLFKQATVGDNTSCTFLET
jgi:diazepam-binding inhibitor (GABA receptor modulator, acyl-CoA-binding protein)